MQRLPLPTGFTVVAVIWIGGRIVLRTGSLDALTIGLDVVFGIAVAAAVTAGIGVQRRRPGGTDATPVYGRATRTGRVDGDTDTSRWPAELARIASVRAAVTR